MSVKWTARALTGMLTMVFMTQPGFAASRAKSPATRGTEVAATPKRIAAIQLRGEGVGAGVRLRYEGRLAALAQQVDLEAKANPAAVAKRVADEFGVTERAIVAEHGRAGSWGDLVIARTLHANMRAPIPATQIVALRRGGMAWTMVAHGVGLDVPDFVAAAEAESKVAIGDAKPDGRVRSIGPAGSGATSVNE